jgi:serine/threonine protein kinase
LCPTIAVKSSEEDVDDPKNGDFSGASDVSTIEPPTAPTPKRIGPYRLLQRIGEGGMGEVWEAEQTEPVRRRVALKLIKPGMDSRQVLARFEAERQALALMDHPAIARVLDAGTTPQGRPYFAMEYVHGERITTYCDRHRLSMQERLVGHADTPRSTRSELLAGDESVVEPAVQRRRRHAE